MLQVGQRAPDFKLPSSEGGMVQSVDLSGAAYLLYFYPKADTPGCTAQACALRDEKARLAALNLRIIGVSPDPVEKLSTFRQKYVLDFCLLSDVDHVVAERYGTWVLKTTYGKTYFGMERSSFLVDAQGIIQATWRKVKPTEHAERVLEAASKL